MKSKIIVMTLLGFLLAACSGQGTATALPTVVLGGGSGQPGAATTQVTRTASVSANGGAAASGYVVAAQEAKLAFTQSGSLKVVNFSAGDPVKAGDVLAELDNTALQLDVAQAERSLSELTSPAAQAATAQALARARQDLEDAQDKVDGQLYRRASDTLIDNTKGEIDLAKQALARAQDSYRQVARLPDGDTKKAIALVAMTNAQLHLNDLLSRYNWFTGKPSEVDAALAQANLDAARAALQEAEWYLSVLKGEPVPQGATGSRLAQLGAARDALTAARDRLAHSRLVAPISGVVVSVSGIAGEVVSPGQVLFFISDVSHLNVETTDLSERDVPKVQVGQAVLVSIKALGQEVPGHVTRISPVADTLGGDVVYKTTIELDAPPEGLLVGMSVDVQYGIAP